MGAKGGVGSPPFQSERKSRIYFEPTCPSADARVALNGNSGTGDGEKSQVPVESGIISLEHIDKFLVDPAVFGLDRELGADMVSFVRRSR